MQKKIIELLTKTDGYVSGSEISEQLGVSRQAVWKAINNLKEEGYKIDSVTNRGYRLVAYPPHLNCNRKIPENLRNRQKSHRP